MSSKRHSRSRSRSRSSGRRVGKRDDDHKPWLKRSISHSRSRSRSPRRSRYRRSRSHSKSKSPQGHRTIMNKDPKFANSRVFVANLASKKITNAELAQIFCRHGRVIDSLVHHNGYGFIQYATEKEARRAVDAESGLEIHGRRIKCNIAGEGKRSGSGTFSGMMHADRDRSPFRDSIREPFNDSFHRGHDQLSRDIRLPPRDISIGMLSKELGPSRDLGLPSRDLCPPRDFGHLRDLDPLGTSRDLSLHSRSPLPPVGTYYDRYRDEALRRDPYSYDIFRDPHRDPYGLSLYNADLPKKLSSVDCEIVIMTVPQRSYADLVERRLKNMNLLTNITLIRDDCTIQQQVEDASKRSCLFAIIINSSNELHHSLTLNILHGVAQEHRNMPLDDALSLVARSFEKFLQAEKEKLASLNEKQSKESSTNHTSKSSVASTPFLPPPKEVSYLLNLLADSRHLTLSELDTVVRYLTDRRDRLSMEEDGLNSGNTHVHNDKPTVDVAQLEPPNKTWEPFQQHHQQEPYQHNVQQLEALPQQQRKEDKFLQNQRQLDLFPPQQMPQEPFSQQQVAQEPFLPRLRQLEPFPLQQMPQEPFPQQQRQIEPFPQDQIPQEPFPLQQRQLDPFPPQQMPQEPFPQQQRQLDPFPPQKMPQEPFHQQQRQLDPFPPQQMPQEPFPQQQRQLELFPQQQVPQELFPQQQRQLEPFSQHQRPLESCPQQQPRQQDFIPQQQRSQDIFSLRPTENFQQQSNFQQRKHEQLQNKILSMMNGSSSTGSAPLSMPPHMQAPAVPLTLNSRPPPLSLAKPSSQQLGPQFNSQMPPLHPTGPGQAAALINFDNPTVQKALDNLIQSGPTLLRNISVAQNATLPSPIQLHPSNFPPPGNMGLRRMPF